MKKKNRMTLVDDQDMYHEMLQNVDALESVFASQGQKYTSVEILSFALGKLNSIVTEDSD